MAEPGPEAPRNPQGVPLSTFPLRVLFSLVVWCFCCLLIPQPKLTCCFSVPSLFTWAAPCKIFLSVWLPWVAKRIKSHFQESGSLRTQSHSYSVLTPDASCPVFLALLLARERLAPGCGAAVSAASQSNPPTGPVWGDHWAWVSDTVSGLSRGGAGRASHRPEAVRTQSAPRLELPVRTCPAPCVLLKAPAL